MGKIKRFDYGVHDDLGQVIGNIFDRFFDEPSMTTFSYRGRLVDENEFDIVPKRKHWDRKLKEEEEKLAKLKKRKEVEDDFYERQIKEAEREIENIKGKMLSP